MGVGWAGKKAGLWLGNDDCVDRGLLRSFTSPRAAGEVGRGSGREGVGRRNFQRDTDLRFSLWMVLDQSCEQFPDRLATVDERYGPAQGCMEDFRGIVSQPKSGFFS